MAFFGQKNTNLAIFMAKSRHTGKIQLDVTYMYITTPHNAQKTLKNLHFEFPRGSLLFSWHCGGCTIGALGCLQVSRGTNWGPVGYEKTSYAHIVFQ